MNFNSDMTSSIAKPRSYIQLGTINAWERSQRQQKHSDVGTQGEIGWKVISKKVVSECLPPILSYFEDVFLCTIALLHVTSEHFSAQRLYVVAQLHTKK